MSIPIPSENKVRNKPNKGTNKINELIDFISKVDIAKRGINPRRNVKYAERLLTIGKTKRSIRIFVIIPELLMKLVPVDVDPWINKFIVKKPQIKKVA
jgi:hypothetical protein